MADPLSIAGSVAGLVAMADILFSRTYRYAKAVKGAAKDIEKLASEIRSLSGILHGLSLVVSELERESFDKTLRLHHINSCRETLTTIERKLAKHDPATAQGQPVQASMRRLKWPFSSSETKELLAEIGRHKATISIALSADNMSALSQALSRQNDLYNGIQDIKDKVEERWAAETRIILDKERQAVLSFFETVDPTQNHKTSLNLRHPLTGLWLTEAEAFRHWLHTRNSKLWLSGIPGAGKTVIAASVIEETINESNVNRAVAYFYCDYKDYRRQDPINILGSLATQLARQNEKAFYLLQQLYLTCHPKDKPSTRPESSDLTDIIRRMMSLFEDVSIIVDGLDECGKHTTNIIESLIGLGSDIGSNARTLFLSRDEHDIRQLLGGHYSHIEIAAHSEDLRLYVAAEISLRTQRTGRGKLRIKNPELKQHIMETLVDRANGMFRWVACQMDYICDLPHDSAIREALKSLPPDLNETYERILARVNECHPTVQKLVQKTLQWIVQSKGVFPIAALCEAVAVEEGASSLDKDSICDEDEILLRCSSLIRKSADAETLELAHFTVQEFLTAIDPDSTCKLSLYSLQPNHVSCSLGRICLTYLNFQNFRNDLPENLSSWTEQCERHPFREYATQWWIEYARQDWANPSLLALAQNLFNPSKTQNFLSWARDYTLLRDRDNYEIDEALFDIITTSVCFGGTTPLHFAAALECVELCQWLLTSGSNVRQMSRLGNPLHCALLGDCVFFLVVSSLEIWVGEPSIVSKTQRHVIQMLIDAQADCESPYRDFDGKTFSCLELALQVNGDIEDLITSLSHAGACIDKEFLAILASIEDKELVKRYVDALQEILVGSEFENDLLQMALDCRSASALHLLKNKVDGPDSTPLEELLDLFRRATRFDQREVMEELLRSNRVDLNAKAGIEEDTALHVAAESGSASAIELLLWSGAELSAVDSEGQTPLHRCAYSWNEDSVSLLLTNGAVTDTVDAEGQTVWHLAASEGNVAVLSVLLDHVDEKDSAVTLQSKNGSTPMLNAARSWSSETLVLLLSKTSQITLTCPDGLSLFHYGVKMNSLEVLQLLLVKGAQPDGRTRNGLTPLHFIKPDAKSSLVRLLINAGVDPCTTENDGETPLLMLIRRGVAVDIEAIKLLATRESVNMATKKGLTALHCMADTSTHSDTFNYTKRLEYFRALHSRGADLTVRDPSGRSCLQILLDQFVQAQQKQAKQEIDGLKDIISYIMENIDDTEILHQPSQNGGRPLNWAIACRQEILVKSLLAKGINVDLRDKTQSAWSALYYATLIGCGKDLYRQLLQNSNLVHEPDATGNYLPHWACSSKSEDVSLLLELFKAGVNVNVPSVVYGKTPLMIAATTGKLNHVQALLRHNADLRAKDFRGWGAVHHAAIYGHVSIIRAFDGLDIQWNCSVEASYKNLRFKECNVLHLAALGGSTQALQYIVQNSLISDLNCKTSSGESPLHLAALAGNSEIVEILLSNGADINAETIFRHCAIHVAAMYGSKGVARSLLEHGCSLIADAKGLRPELLALKYGHKEVATMLSEYSSQQGVYIYYSRNVALQPQETAMPSLYLFQALRKARISVKKLSLY